MSNPSTKKVNQTAKPAKPEQTSGKRGSLEVSILHTRCIGAAVCVYEARGAFKLNKNRKAVITDLKKASEKAIINCARNCPMQAIFVYRNQKQIWPDPNKDATRYQPDAKTKILFD